jgi:hypothetical protein
MKILLDTHIFLWFISGDAHVSQPTRRGVDAFARLNVFFSHKPRRKPFRKSCGGRSLRVGLICVADVSTE